VIRQRDSAVPGERAEETGVAVASIAPDDLAAFARDLRALRAKAGLDLPDMAELSHFSMKTLASAAGGLRLPTLPVAVAYVRACQGDVTEWEERWQKLADRMADDTAKKRRNDGSSEENDQSAELPAAAEPPALGPAETQAPETEAPGSGEVYVITSAKPRPPAW
jgi:Helix-turn-helix domain